MMMMMQQMNKTSAHNHTDLNISKNTLQTAPETHYSIKIYSFLRFFSLFPKDYEDGRSIIVNNRIERAFRSRPAVVGEPFLEELHLSLKFQAEFCLKRSCFTKKNI